MRRIYFLVPNVGTTARIVDELLLARVGEKHIHVLARRGTPLEALPEATFAQKTDFIPALEQGIALGGMTGLLAGLAALALPTGLVLGGGAVLGISLLGAGVGAWVSGMIGAGIGNRHIKEYEAAIDKGELLVMVDVPRDRVPDIEERVKKHHPGADCRGTEPTIPPFP